eukprot:CAMPEP_0178438278 /NCGR_PEP_ID=MMETSP0689_2-20121128/35505_1 /TAXON_ID=160604 /ORGANISM="Amphidinium massartii, Strain CS-259" /LENGTH=92 /DNA_ID=CAMNT_0020060665 /DNA_START=131 /DNA_END=406 /DNA_ORIENTATION=-
MTAAWANLPEEERMPKDEEKPFWEERPLDTCMEMIQRWHSGESSHPDKVQLAGMYTCDEAGQRQLYKDLSALKDDPFVSAAELRLRLTKYTA